VRITLFALPIKALKRKNPHDQRRSRGLIASESIEVEEKEADNKATGITWYLICGGVVGKTRGRLKKTGSHFSRKGREIKGA